jgi:phosphoglycerate dehydrogenase-like enzyme
MDRPRIALAPANARGWLADAIRDGGGEVVDVGEAIGLVWTQTSAPDELARVLADNPGIEWVQLPFAGIEPYRDVLDAGHTWACGKGVYADPVAEHALALALAGMRGLGTYGRAASWSGPQGRNLLHAKVTVLGAGGITESLVRLLEPFDVELTVVRRRPDPFPGAARTLTFADVDEALPGADLVVLALALTADTTRVIDARRLSLMEPHAWLVNVARGAHIATDDLVVALQAGIIGGAALDVTDPEPLPDGHPLWSMANCLITPHVGNTPEMAVPLLSARVTENVRRFAAGEPLVGLVDVEAGY